MANRRAGFGICVSIVIPTHQRPALVAKAVRSALAQDFTAIEVIVVVDGDDPATHLALAEVSDPRLRVIACAENVGGAEARNTGVREARGEWIAFLDDDDEWLPHKLSRQIVAARRSTAAWPVISSRLIVRTPFADIPNPLRSYHSSRPLSEFLFCRKSFRDGPFALQTSTLFARREMLLTLPFHSGLPRHQDWDWLLRAEYLPGVEFSVMDEPLVLVHAQDSRSSISRSLDWRFSLEWARGVRAHFSPRAYSWFIAAECASRAAKSRAGIAAYAEITREFVFHGFPGLRSTVMLLSFFAIPREWREYLRKCFKVRYRNASEQSSQMPTTIQMEV